jgi:hypothetical protein
MPARGNREPVRTTIDQLTARCDVRDDRAMRSTLRRSLGAALLIGLLGACVLAAPASAHYKPYSVVIDPASVGAGQRVAFTATITNRAQYSKLGSANLTAPDAFKVVSASVNGYGTATVSGNVVQLRNLGLKPGASATVTVSADVPCAEGSFDWTVRAQESGDFSDYEDLGPLVKSSLSTSVSGACAVALRFAGQPASARVGEAITTTPYNSPAGGPVTVEVLDGAGHVATTSSAAITIGLGPGSGSGALSGTKVVTAVDGVAMFDDLSISAQGSYTLVASSPGLESATSSTFRIDEAATVCAEGATCTATLSNSTATIDVTARSSASQVDAGVLTINRNVGPPLNCAGYTELSDGDFAVDFLPNDPDSPERAKVVGLTISKEAMDRAPENGAAHLNICFGADFPFDVKPGTPPLQPFEGLNIGLLPDCGEFGPPCVSKRKKISGGRGFIQAQAPDDNRDPRYGP